MANDCTHTGEMLVSKYMTDLLIKDIKASVNGCSDDSGAWHFLLPRPA